jgi:hypothetical protein
MDRDVSHVGTAARRARPLHLDSHGATRVSPDIRLQRWFEAPPDVVFDAYTDPDAQRDLRAGGPTGSWSPSVISVSEASGSSGLARPRRPMSSGMSSTPWRGHTTSSTRRPPSGRMDRTSNRRCRSAFNGWMDGRFSRSRNEGSSPATSNEGSPKAGTSSWTGSWPGSRHGPRPEPAEIGEMA